MHFYPPAPFEPKVKMDICYIVCGLLFDDQGRVLMMREAKSSCYGQWYLPAGRMEQDETIVVRALIHLPLDKKGRHFKDDIFRKFWILIKISLKFVPKGPINWQ